MTRGPAASRATGLAASIRRRVDSPRTRAFALPLVVIVVLIASLLLAALLERQSAHNQLVARQVDSYGSIHLERGISEIVSAWLMGVRARGLAEALDETGLGITIRPEQGEGLRVSFFEAQGTALRELTGLRDDTRELALSILARLQVTASPERALQLTRDAGPIAIAVNSAPPELLLAAIQAALNDESGENLVADIMNARESGRITPEQLRQTIESQSLDPKLRTRVEGVLTANPVLWKVVVEPDRQRRQGEPWVRYEGLALTAPPSKEEGGGPKRSSPILYLRRVDVR